MRIFGAIGLGLTIVILKTLVPVLFSAFEETLLQLFYLMQASIAISLDVINRMNVR